MKRHDTDWTSLIAGITFAAIAIAYLGSEIAHRTLEVRWVIPLLLIGLGVAGLASTVVRARRLAVTVEPLEVPDAADATEA